MPRTPMELRALAGQLLILGFDGTEPAASLLSRLRTLAPGGIILFARNIESPRQTHALLKAAQKTAELPLFRCVDMEGGTVDRLRDVIDPVPSVEEVAGAGNRQLYREHGRLIGDAVRALGFNVDFAPVIDLRFEASRSVLGSRTVSADPEATCAYARGFLGGLKEAGVLGCGKHFPGLGEGRLDSHQALPVVRKSWKQLWSQDLVPYRLLAGRLPFVMVAHCAYPEVSGEMLPASISKKWIGEILRRKIGYKGLVVSDDLEMGGVLNVATIEEAAVETIRAGADLYLVCHTEELVQRAWEAVLREAERDRRFRTRVETAARRILAAKRRWAVLRERFAPAPSEAAVNRLRQRIWIFDEAIRLESNALAAQG